MNAVFAAFIASMRPKHFCSGRQGDVEDVSKLTHLLQ
ncbi:protein of unknown function [Azospirillum lipoferum 4B]|uniref:Uncharacterized protein n=1 Tax=Azospirillum lipoferum (strain 4B) TaxID=862719 RepID=G7Z7K9_AZOL4|nr:protein of unknown function [Azospirillum lipoferum 4B]